MSTHSSDKARTLIQSLGGPTRLAEMLGYDVRKGGAQRVANWQRRGIPAEVRLQRPDIFAPIDPMVAPAGSAHNPSMG